METKKAIVIFEDLPIRKIEKDGEIWVSALDVAKALEYSNPSVTIQQIIIERNSDRFKGYSTINSLLVVEGGRKVKREMIFLNLKGVIAFCMLSKQPKAVPFQRWADSVLEKELLNIPDDIRIIAKKKRVEFTETLKTHGYNKPVEYATTTKQMKKAIGIDENKPKSECDLIEVMKIATAEMLAKTNIMITEASGFNEVNPICIESGKVIEKHTKKQLKE
jgi:prophage antirepressor-like protein